MEQRILDQWLAEDVAHEKLQRVLDAEETYYREVEADKVMKSLKEWTEEFPVEYRKERRREYLLDAIRITRDRFFTECKLLAKRDDTFTYWTELHIQSLEKQLYRLSMEAKILTGKETGITPEKIAYARKYPIDRLIKVVRGQALCPFHNDRHPSMDVRKNFYYCYTCNATGDAIDLAMKLRGISFKEAINLLS